MSESLEDIRLRDYVPVSMMTAKVATVTAPTVSIVDVHNHLGRWGRSAWRVPDPAALVASIGEAGVATIVNLDGGWTDELEDNVDRCDRAYKGRFPTFARLDWSERSTPGWGENAWPLHWRIQYVVARPA